MGFPNLRLRRLRRTEPLRTLVRETSLTPGQLVLPLFVRSGTGIRECVPSMPGVFRLSPDEVVKEACRAHTLGVGAVILFGLPSKKDPEGSEAWSDRGAVQQTLRNLRDACPNVVRMADTCLCEYTDHGHCGPLQQGTHDVDNDAAIERLGRIAVSQAAAGADVVAPSAMMDGQVAAIRGALDQAGFVNCAILSYASKYASCFYGPFRDAADCAPQHGDRRGYQMDPANTDEAIREARLDVDEGADVLMVKPGLPYLDVIRRIKQELGMPTAAYCVSGEFAMIEAAAAAGAIDRKRAVLEVLLCLRRAGADFILTYWAAEAARWLREEGGAAP